MSWVSVGMAGGAAGLSFFGGREAAKATNLSRRYQNRASQEGLDASREQFDYAQGLMRPFLQAGQQQLDGLSGTAGAGGFGDQIAQLLGQGGGYDALIDSRSQDARDQVFTQGLSRSGAGQMAMASVPTDTAMDIENMLRQRQQALAGQGGTAGISMGNLGQLNSQSFANNMGNRGDISAGNLLGQAQINQGMINNLIGLGSSAIGAFAGGGQMQAPQVNFGTPPSIQGYAPLDGGYNINRGVA